MHGPIDAPRFRTWCGGPVRVRTGSGAVHACMRTHLSYRTVWGCGGVAAGALPVSARDPRRRCRQLKTPVGARAGSGVVGSGGS
jgi:hypothetical protein